MKGKTTQSLFNFKHEPTGSVYNDNGGIVYYQDTKGNWFKDIFNKNGVFQNSQSLKFTELLADELLYSVDLNNDNNVGDTVHSVIAER